MHDAYAACVKRPSSPSPDALVGTSVAQRYRIGDMIGSGVTGMVFAAEHLAFARPCTIKVVRARHATPDLVQRVFHGDGLAAWGLPHPSLVDVYDVGALPDGTPYFVMERLDGESLATRIARERLSLAAAIDVMMQLLSAIVALHARELLIRDLRPNNVFLVHRRGCRPLVKLLDVGLARLAPIEKLQEEWSTLGPMTNGYPHYLSPERARGEHLVEVASDLFVAGAIFYEALAGQRAFDGQSWRAISDAACTLDPRPLNERRNDVPPELGQFLARAMAKDPRKRPSTAKEMQDELRAIFEDARKQSVSMYQPSTASIYAPSSRRMPVAAITGPMAEPYKEETDTHRARAAMPSTVIEEPHPALQDEMEQTLERVGGVSAAHSEPLTKPGVPVNAPVNPLRDSDEDETETTQMTPELRARIDQLIGGDRPPKSRR